jgi:putative transposase
MSQSLSAVYVHFVFSTKNREPFMRDMARRQSLHAYLGGICGTLECPPVLVGGTDDHVHVLARMSRTVTLADCVKELKRVSSGWFKEQGPGCAAFEWQSGYGAFSVSQSSVGRVTEYIAGQEQHHRKMGFQDELRALLQKHSIVWDEKYVWD